MTGRMGSPRTMVVVAMLLVLVSLLCAGPATAGPPLPPTEPTPEGTVTLEAVLAGTGGVRGRAHTDPTSAGLDVVLVVENATAAPVDLLVEPGTLLATDRAGEQTTVLSEPFVHPDYASAPSGDGYVVTLEPGQTRVELAGYCAEELDLGSTGELHYAGMAADPLPRVMRNIAAADADPWTAQDAVWWVTDDPELPVFDPGVEALLDGVDTDEFAADPHRVVLDSTYTPVWDGGEASLGADTPLLFDPTGGRSGVSPLVWLVAVAVVAGLAFLLIRAGSRRGAAATPATARHPGAPQPLKGLPTRPPGWYVDPWTPRSLRWWDGATWTDHTSETR